MKVLVKYFAILLLVVCSTNDCQAQSYEQIDFSQKYISPFHYSTKLFGDSIKFHPLQLKLSLRPHKFWGVPTFSNPTVTMKESVVLKKSPKHQINPSQFKYTHTHESWATWAGTLFLGVTRAVCFPHAPEYTPGK